MSAVHVALKEEHKLAPAILTRMGLEEVLLRQPWWMLLGLTAAVPVAALCSKFLPPWGTFWVAAGTLFLAWSYLLQAFLRRQSRHWSALLMRAKGYDSLLDDCWKQLPSPLQSKLSALNTDLRALVVTFPRERHLSAADRLLVLQTFADYVPRILSPVCTRLEDAVDELPRALQQVQVLHDGVRRVQLRLREAHELDAQALMALLIERTGE